MYWMIKTISNNLKTKRLVKHYMPIRITCTLFSIEFRVICQIRYL